MQQLGLFKGAGKDFLKNARRQSTGQIIVKRQVEQSVTFDKSARSASFSSSKLFIVNAQS